MLRGPIRDHVTQQRRPFLRFFACEQDLSHELPDEPLPNAVATGERALVGSLGLLMANGRLEGSQEVEATGLACTTFVTAFDVQQTATEEEEMTKKNQA